MRNKRGLAVSSLVGLGVLGASLYPHERTEMTYNPGATELRATVEKSKCAGFVDYITSARNEVNGQLQAYCHTSESSFLADLTDPNRRDALSDKGKATIVIGYEGGKVQSSEVSGGNIPDIVGALNDKKDANGKRLIVNQAPLKPFTVIGDPFASRAVEPNAQNTTPKQTF